MEPASVDPSKCPLCGRANRCAIASGTDAACWCASVKIAPAALARIPPELQNVACLCPECAAGTAAAGSR